jgi:hypothetical protein
MIAGHRCTGRYIVAIILVFLLLSFATLGWLRKHRMKVLERPALMVEVVLGQILKQPLTGAFYSSWESAFGPPFF